MHCTAIQYNTIQYNTIQYNTIQYNTIQYNTMQYNTIRCNTERENTIQYNTIQYNTIQYNTIQYNTIQYNTIQYNTIQEKMDTAVFICSTSVTLNEGQGHLYLYEIVDLSIFYHHTKFERNRPVNVRIQDNFLFVLFVCFYQQTT